MWARWRFYADHWVSEFAMFTTNLHGKVLKMSIRVHMASSTPTSSQFELPLSVAMSTEGGQVSARARVNCQEGKFDRVKVGVEGDILGVVGGRITSKTISYQASQASAGFPGP